MRLLALDPSSVAIGWASFHDAKLKHAGVIKASNENLIHRLQTMDDYLMELLDITKPDRIAIEMHEGFPFARNQRGDEEKRSPKTAATLSHAQGWILNTVVSVVDDGSVDIIGDLTWTNKIKKERRAARVHAAYPDFQHVWIKDTKFDAADAVGIGLYWMQQAATKSLIERGKSLKTRLPGDV